MSDKNTITFDFEKSTKNAHRFKENAEDEPKIGTIYFKKNFVKDIAGSDEAPQKVRITVEFL